MTGIRTQANCLRDAERAIAESIFPRVTRPIDLMDETQFPELAEARRHYASLSPERKAELEMGAA